MRKTILLILIVFVCLLSYQPAIAQEPLLLKKDFTSVTPVFMEGHANDMDWIQGYRFEGDIILDGVKIGTVNGEVTLLNPPVDMSQQYYEAFGIFNNNLDDIGSFQVFAQVQSYGGESSASTGDGIIAWHGSITNGSGALQGLKGLSAGTGNYNLFTGKGAGTEVLQISLE
jgi:hypothetical protein